MIIIMKKIQNYLLIYIVTDDFQIILNIREISYFF